MSSSSSSSSSSSRPEEKSEESHPEDVFAVHKPPKDKESRKHKKNKLKEKDSKRSVQSSLDNTTSHRSAHEIELNSLRHHSEDQSHSTTTASSHATSHTSQDAPHAAHESQARDSSRRSSRTHRQSREQSRGRGARRGGRGRGRGRILPAYRTSREPWVGYGTRPLTAEELQRLHALRQQDDAEQAPSCLFLCIGLVSTGFLILALVFCFLSDSTDPQANKTLDPKLPGTIGLFGALAYVLLLLFPKKPHRLVLNHQLIRGQEELV